jgi:hypothetical protein
LLDGLPSGGTVANLQLEEQRDAIDRELRKIGMDVRASSPEEMRTMIAGQIAKWKKVVADAQIPQQ